jgi:hypothetical protein
MTPQRWHWIWSLFGTFRELHQLSVRIYGHIDYQQTQFTLGDFDIQTVQPVQPACIVLCSGSPFKSFQRHVQMDWEINPAKEIPHRTNARIVISSSRPKVTIKMQKKAHMNDRQIEVCQITDNTACVCTWCCSMYCMTVSRNYRYSLYRAGILLS